MAGFIRCTNAPGTSGRIAVRACLDLSSAPLDEAIIDRLVGEYQ